MCVVELDPEGIELFGLERSDSEASRSVSFETAVRESTWRELGDTR